MKQTHKTSAVHLLAPKLTHSQYASMGRVGHPKTPNVKDEMPEFNVRNAMRWPSVEDTTARAPLPSGYRYEYLDRQQIPTLITALKAWYPGIVVGNASC